MKVFLSARDRDLDLGVEQPAGSDAVIQDLGLDILFGAMASGDRYLLEVAKRTIPASLDTPDAIRYRQAVLADCLDQPDVIRELYAIAVEAIDIERRAWIYTSSNADSLLRRSVEVLGKFTVLLRRLRGIADGHRGAFRSEGFTRFFDEIVRELDDRYLETVDAHLRGLRFQDGVRLSAELGWDARGTDYVLRRRIAKRGWRERVGLPEPESYTWELPPRDDAGAQVLGELKARGIALAAGALARSTDHILSYFVQLRAEVGFYVACLNLHDRLAAKGEPTCMPDPVAAGALALSARGLYDPCLSLSLGTARVVGSDVDADDKLLVVVTGANRGGKSTFLRSVGVAQLMMQSGMFVPAQAHRADIRRGLLTHFRREEDTTLESGKLDEELKRMSSIVDLVTPDSLVLLNESFASTNEREGSEIGRQIVRALLEAGIKVVYVTHMYDLASGLHDERRDGAAFLRAERLADGRRTFRIVEGQPLPTSHGQDIYRRIFGEDAGATGEEREHTHLAAPLEIGVP